MSNFQWDKELSERIAAQAAQFQTIFTRAQEQASQLGGHLATAQRELAERLASITFDFSPIQKIAEDFQRQIDVVQRSFAELPSRLQEATLLLAQHGWFFSMKMPLSALWELEKSISEGDLDTVDESLVAYFEEHLEEIEHSALEQFPHRHQLVRSAFGGHRRQEYEMCIPLYLAQIDGICKDAVDQYFFTKERGKNRPSTAIYVEEIASDTLKAALLSPLAVTSQINASERERGAGFSGLNRHMVMHGESLDYGTKVNSFKTISLLNYVVERLKPQ